MALSERRKEWSREYFKKRRASDPAFKARQAEARKRYRDRLNASGLMKELKAKQHLKYTYGISKEEYDGMLKSQGGCCAICSDLPNKFVVDHDHETGAVRGLLCSNCNTGIGMFKDNTSLLGGAIKYLSDRLAHGE